METRLEYVGCSRICYHGQEISWGKQFSFKLCINAKTVGKGKGVSVEYYEMRDRETKRRFDSSVLDGMTADEQKEYMDKNVYWLRKFYRVFNCSLMDGIPEKEKTADRYKRPKRASRSNFRVLG